MIQCKWGRHCCRPHSHRRVGAMIRDAGSKLLASLFIGTLGARCLDLHTINLATIAIKVSSPALAPASGFRFRLAIRSRSLNLRF